MAARSPPARVPGTGYLERMARHKLAESAHVPIRLKVSEADAARIDEVLTRPEFAGWTRPEWCREIIRSALRYYVAGAPAPDPGQARAAVRPADAPPGPPSQPPPPAAASSPAPAPSPADEAAAADGAGAAGEPRDAPEPPAQPECPHPADARDYETGTCAACGAILWD
jgi:hypothetical protein